MTGRYISAPAGEIAWRYEVAPDRGAKVMLLNTGGVAVFGHWYGELGEAFQAWCPMPRQDVIRGRAVMPAYKAKRA